MKTFAYIFRADIINDFKLEVKQGLRDARVVRTTEVLMKVDKNLPIPKRFIIVTKRNKTFMKVKRVLEDMGLRLEHPSCRHYLLGDIISVKIERPREQKIYFTYKRPGEWVKV